MIDSVLVLAMYPPAIEPIAAHANPPAPAAGAVTIPNPTQIAPPILAPANPPPMPDAVLAVNLVYSLNADFPHSFSLPVEHDSITLFVAPVNENAMPIYPPVLRKRAAFAAFDV